VEVADRRHGRVTGLIDDFVVRRSDGAPAYQVAVVVDDDDQVVEEVVRGDDLLDTTPRQVWLARRLGLAVPAYAHVPLVLGPDGRRLAKRHGAVTLAELRSQGVEPSIVLGAMGASLGLVPAGTAVSTASDLVAGFDPEDVPRAPWRFDPATWRERDALDL
jgi:glutamyl-tRNA synthetase